MSNDYFNHNSPLSRHTLARAEGVNAIANAVAAGFNKLPGASVANQGLSTFAADGGSANTYTATMHKTWTSYETGARVYLGVANTNTGASTLNVDGLGARSIKRIDGTDPEAADLTAGDVVELIYNGTDFILLSPYRSHLAGIANNLGADLIFSGNPQFTGSPDFSEVDNKSTIRSDLGVPIQSSESDLTPGRLQKVGNQGFFKKIKVDTNNVGSASDIVFTANAVLASEESLSHTMETGGYWRWMVNADSVDTGTAGADEIARLDSEEFLLNVPLTGTAVQTSPTDTTAGRLMSVGAFGLGGAEIPSLVGDVFQDLATGLYYARPPTSDGAADTPESGNWNVLKWQRDASFQAALLIPQADGAPEAYLGVYHDSVQSDWARLIHSENLIGTVSQSGGTPTGAVIEEGSNSDGKYVRYADGTQICWAKDVNLGSIVAGGSGTFADPYRTGSPVTLTWPAQFSEAPSVGHTLQLSGDTSVSAGSRALILQPSSAPTSSSWISLRAQRVSADSLNRDALLSAIAIGRWF